MKKLLEKYLRYDNSIVRVLMTGAMALLALLLGYVLVTVGALMAKLIMFIITVSLCVCAILVIYTSVKEVLSNIAKND